jgi:hypothetical protein
MGMGLVLSALSGAGQGVADAAQTYEKYNFQSMLQKEEAGLAVQKADLINQHAIAAKNADEAATGATYLQAVNDHIANNPVVGAAPVQPAAPPATIPDSTTPPPVAATPAPAATPAAAPPIPDATGQAAPAAAPGISADNLASAVPAQTATPPGGLVAQTTGPIPYATRDAQLAGAHAAGIEALKAQGKFADVASLAAANKAGYIELGLGGVMGPDGKVINSPYAQSLLNMRGDSLGAVADQKRAAAEANIRNVVAGSLGVTPQILNDWQDPSKNLTGAQKAESAAKVATYTRLYNGAMSLYEHGVPAADAVAVLKQVEANPTKTVKINGAGIPMIRVGGKDVPLPPEYAAGIHVPGAPAQPGKPIAPAPGAAATLPVAQNVKMISQATQSGDPGTDYVPPTYQWFDPRTKIYKQGTKDANGNFVSFPNLNGKTEIFTGQ